MPVSHRAILAAALLAACGPSDRDADVPAPETAPEQTVLPAEERADAAPLWRQVPDAPAVDDRARWDTTWRGAPSVDSAISLEPVRAADSASIGARTVPDSLFRIDETWDEIGADSAATADAGIQLPLGGRVAGPSVLKTQVLLDRANFSPGVLDGRWGGNVERAVFWFQRSQGLRPTGWLDAETLRRLEATAGSEPLVGTRALTAEDVEGPYTDIPADVQQRAKLDCLCPESRIEKIAEQAHTTPDVLRQLNPDVDWETVAAGDRIRMPLPESADDAREPGARTAADSSAAATDTAAVHDIARIVISDRGRYLHAYDAAGTLVFHFPATLGSEYNPSPSGRLEVTSVTLDPWFHYQPELLEGADPNDPSVRLAPGMNSPVGLVWIALSKEHYGIHGTSAPETIGYVTSSGCIRLTNWDAVLLARHVGPGTVVEFRDPR